MISRRVTHTGKDAKGDITKLCNSASAWSFVTKASAIKQIEAKTHSYYVEEEKPRVDVQVVPDKVKGKYLRTTADSTSKNNLGKLPDCD